MLGEWNVSAMCWAQSKCVSNFVNKNIGLQQCVNSKNGTSISNPVMHRDCRSMTGSTTTNGILFIPCDLSENNYSDNCFIFSFFF